MTADSRRRSFPEFAKLLSKEPGWADEESALQEILGAFLCGELSDVTWPRGDVPVQPDGVHLMTIRYELAYERDKGPKPIRRVNVPVKTPPQEAVSRDEWLQAFRAFGEQDRHMGADWVFILGGG